MRIKININVGRMESRIDKLWNRLSRCEAPGGVLGVGRDGTLWINGHPVGTERPVGGFLVVPEAPASADEWEAEYAEMARSGHA